MRWFLLLGLVLAACGDDGQHPSDASIDGTVACPRTRATCSLATQTGCAAGEKCTWIIDAETPQYVGHIGCAPAGTADVDQPCMFGPPGCDGYDNCKRGFVCSDYGGGPGVCKQICDPDGGQPACNAQHSCEVYSGLFSTGESTPAAAGVCDQTCNPFTDNDFDGAGGASTKTTTVCGTGTSRGCYGYPSFGTYPPTGWSCTDDTAANLAQPTGLRHRVLCTDANGCTDNGQLYVNSCNQGYLPLLRESTMTSTTICVALCKPKNCYAGNCGGGTNPDRLGVAPHRCQTPDRVGTFDTSANGEHCRFIWSFEIDDQNNFLRSPSSDTVGFCFDHSKYPYDSDGDNVPDATPPACATLPDGFGAGSAWGAADLGCVDTTHAGLPAQGKAHRRTFDDLRPLTTRLRK